MLLQEVNSNVQTIIDENSDSMVSINDVTASWDEKSHVLENIDLEFAPKLLYAIVGSIGSGKVFSTE